MELHNDGALLLVEDVFRLGLLLRSVLLPGLLVFVFFFFLLSGDDDDDELGLIFGSLFPVC